MRNLRNEDMYILSKIADKMDLTFPKAPVIAKDASDEIKDNIKKEWGREFITLMVRRIHRAENEINQLLSNVSEKSMEEVSNMSVKETVSTLTSILKQDGVLDFFK